MPKKDSWLPAPTRENKEAFDRWFPDVLFWLLAVLVLLLALCTEPSDRPEGFERPMSERCPR